MKNYVVSWEIDISAATPEAAAREAFSHMQRPGTTATCFTVTDEAGDSTSVDLLENEL